MARKVLSELSKIKEGRPEATCLHLLQFRHEDDPVEEAKKVYTGEGLSGNGWRADFKEKNLAAS
jgi:hypothetical protein